MTDFSFGMAGSGCREKSPPSTLEVTWPRVKRRSEPKSPCVGCPDAAAVAMPHALPEMLLDKRWCGSLNCSSVSQALHPSSFFGMSNCRT